MMDRHADTDVDNAHTATTRAAGMITVGAILLLVFIRFSMERK